MTLPQNVVDGLLQMGAPPAVVDFALATIEQNHEKRIREDRRSFFRALVLELVRANEAEFDSDPAVAAKKVVERARRIEAEIRKHEEKEDRGAEIVRNALK